jgi:hypothetical protein
MTSREQFLNKDEDLWLNLNENSADFVRKFRSTACPIMGDDDLEDDDMDDEDDSSGNEDQDDSSNEEREDEEKDKN